MAFAVFAHRILHCVGRRYLHSALTRAINYFFCFVIRCSRQQSKLPCRVNAYCVVNKYIILYICCCCDLKPEFCEVRAVVD